MPIYSINTTRAHEGDKLWIASIAEFKISALGATKEDAVVAVIDAVTKKIEEMEKQKIPLPLPMNAA